MRPNWLRLGPAWSRSNPGCAIIPAAFAAAEQFGLDGAQFLRVVTRVTMTLGSLDFQIKEHKSTYSFAGIFGAAAAAGCAANFCVQKMRWLLDYSAQQASGIAAWQRDTEHIEKAFALKILLKAAPLKPRNYAKS